MQIFNGIFNAIYDIGQPQETSLQWKYSKWIFPETSFLVNTWKLNVWNKTVWNIWVQSLFCHLSYHDVRVCPFVFLSSCRLVVFLFCGFCFVWAILLWCWRFSRFHFKGRTFRPKFKVNIPIADLFTNWGYIWPWKKKHYQKVQKSNCQAVTQHQ